MITNDKKSHYLREEYKLEIPNDAIPLEGNPGPATHLIDEAGFCPLTPSCPPVDRNEIETLNGGWIVPVRSD